MKVGIIVILILFFERKTQIVRGSHKLHLNRLGLWVLSIIYNLNSKQSIMQECCFIWFKLILTLKRTIGWTLIWHAVVILRFMLIWDGNKNMM